MNIKIYYYTSNHEDPYNDWDVIVSHGKLNETTGKLVKTYPKKSDLQKSGYALLPLPSSYWDSFNIKGKDNLDKIYGELNKDFGNPLATYGMQQLLRNLNIRHTSMSIGDVVVLNGRAFVCNSGWTEI